MNIREQRFDKKKAERLLSIVTDPVFMEATDLVMDRVTVPLIGASVESAALHGAFISGVKQAFRELEDIPTLFEEKPEPKKPPIPWGHVKPKTLTTK
jgi:hypothetical protein